MKKGNKGFSLVEVMIAITILAIIVTPFLASFLRATKINAKSRKMLRATTVAENVMEGLSGFLIEDISKQFTQKTDDDDNPIYGSDGKPETVAPFLILNNRAEGDSFTFKELGVKSVKGEVFSQKPGNIYEYALFNVTEDKQKFDVKITVDANKYRDVAAEKLQTGQDYNIAAGKMFNVSEMNPKTDIVWAEPVGLGSKYKDDYIFALKNDPYYDVHVEKPGDEEFVKKRKEEQAEILESVNNEGDNFLAHCSRLFNLVIEDDSVSIIISLVYDKYGRGYILDSSQKYFPSITGKERRDNLKNIFLCYYPNYDLVKDVIQINDLTGLDDMLSGELSENERSNYNFYVIKQEANASSNAQEEFYKVDFNIYTAGMMIEEFTPEILEQLIAKYGEEKIREYGFPFTIRGNLGHYFEKEGEIHNLITNQVNFQMKYGTEEDPMRPWTIARPISEEILNKMDVYDKVIRYSGIDRSTKNLIYNTTVDVYEAEAYDAATGKFDESKHIAKLDSEQAEIE